MLYTSYLANIKNITDDVIFYFIARKAPKGFNFDNDKDKEEVGDIIFKPDLSPTLPLLEYYKSGQIDWSKYEKLFKNQMVSNSQTIIALNALKKKILNKEDIVLICYEKDYTKCHRRLVALKIEEMINKEVWDRSYETLKTTI